MDKTEKRDRRRNMTEEGQRLREVKRNEGDERLRETGGWRTGTLQITSSDNKQL